MTTTHRDGSWVQGGGEEEEPLFVNALCFLSVSVSQGWLAVHIALVNKSITVSKGMQNWILHCKRWALDPPVGCRSVVCFACAFAIVSISAGRSWSWLLLLPPRTHRLSAAGNNLPRLSAPSSSTSREPHDIVGPGIGADFAGLDNNNIAVCIFYNDLVAIPEDKEAVALDNVLEASAEGEGQDRAAEGRQNRNQLIEKTQLKLKCFWEGVLKESLGEKVVRCVLLQACVHPLTWHSCPDRLS